MKTIPEDYLDLTERPVATLATIGPDGRPQLSALWFLYEDGKLKVSLNNTRQKTKNLMANPVATLFILDAGNYRYLEVRADVTIEADDSYEFADRVAAKYDTDLRQMDGLGESRVMVTFEPVRVNAVDMTTGTA